LDLQVRTVRLLHLIDQVNSRVQVKPLRRNRLKAFSTSKFYKKVCTSFKSNWGSYSGTVFDSFRVRTYWNYQVQKTGLLLPAVNWENPVTLSSVRFTETHNKTQNRNVHENHLARIDTEMLLAAYLAVS